MDRRKFLAAGVTGFGVVIAGCSEVLGGTITLANPETEVQDGGREKYLTYHHSDDRIVTVGFDQQTIPATQTDQFEFRISVSHSVKRKSSRSSLTSASHNPRLILRRTSILSLRVAGCGPTSRFGMSKTGGHALRLQMRVNSEMER